MKPLVSIVAISYNHSLFLQQALSSLWQQSFRNWEVIIIDDASTDSSAFLIRDFIEQNPCQNVKKCIFHSQNKGICKSFNEALKLCEGKYVIDFSLDDVMLPCRIEQQVEFFESLPEQVGLIFSNAQIIDSKGKFLHYHYPVNKYGKAQTPPPQSNFFREVLRRYFICPPTIMYRKKMLEELGGYNEELAYEDFDLWIRASQKYEFAYLDKVTTLYRKHTNSLSFKFYQKKQNELLSSTLKILQNAYSFCCSQEDYQALAQSVQYHLRQCYLAQDLKLWQQYDNFLRNSLLSNYQNLLTKLVRLLAQNSIDLSFFYDFYRRYKQILQVIKTRLHPFRRSAFHAADGCVFPSSLLQNDS